MITKEYLTKKHQQLLEESTPIQELLESCDDELTQEETEDMYSALQCIRDAAQSAMKMFEPYL